jgi:hypothetical protein
MLWSLIHIFCGLIPFSSTRAEGKMKLSLAFDTDQMRDGVSKQATALYTCQLAQEFAVAQYWWTPGGEGYRASFCLCEMIVE